MRQPESRLDSDCVVVGASFGGLASAHALATAGLRVTVVEKKTDPGAKLHTTGIIVKDAVDQIPLLDALPAARVRRIPGVRLYAPNLKFVDLAAPGYYFLATDTPNVMRWLAAVTEPPCIAAIRCTSARPMPRPVRCGVTWTNRSKIWSRSTGSMPSPVSANVTVAASAASATAIVTRPWRGV